MTPYAIRPSLKKIYTVESFIDKDSIKNIGTLVHIINPKFLSEEDSLFFELPGIEAYYKIKRSRRSSILRLYHKKSYQMTPSLAIDYGDLTIERFMQEFGIMAGDIGIQGTWGRPQFSLMGIMDKFNGFFPQNMRDYKTFIDGPSINTMNIRFNELLNSKDEFLRIMFKDEQGNFRFRESILTSEGNKIMKTTIKSWLSQYWISLKNYGGDDADIKTERDFLDQLLSDKSETYNDLDIGDSTTSPSEMRELRMYAQTLQEAAFAQEVFASALRLLGQGTVRLTFSNMLDYYGNNFGTSSNIRLKPLTRPIDIFECWAHLGLISPTHNKIYSTKADKDYAHVSNKIFSMIFLDSYMYIPMKGYENSDINILKFPMGPLVGVGTSIVGGSTQWLFRNELTASFILHYDNIVETNTFSSFVFSQKSLVDILVDKAYDILVNPGGHTGKDQYIFETIKKEVQRQLQVLKLSRPNTESAQLRIEINEFIESHESSKTFDLGKILGVPVVIELSQDDLIGSGYIYMTNLDKNVDYAIKERILLPKVRDSADLLTKAIKAFHSDGRAEIVPIVDFTDPLMGSQFLLPQSGKTSLKKYMQLPKGSGTFEIDVNTRDGRRALEYISYLLSYHFNNHFSTISFLVKSADGTLSDGLGDFLITRNGIYKVGKLYSPQAPIQKIESFAKSPYMIDLIQMRFDGYYVGTVHPTIIGQVIEMSTEDYINIINEEWNLIWGDGVVVIAHDDLDRFIRPRYVDLLNNPYLVDRYSEKGWID